MTRFALGDNIVFDPLPELSEKLPSVDPWADSAPESAEEDVNTLRDEESTPRASTSKLPDDFDKYFKDLPSLTRDEASENLFRNLPGIIDKPVTFIDRLWMINHNHHLFYGKGVICLLFIATRVIIGI